MPKKLIFLCATGLAAFAATPAMAQVLLEEITVTATKREQTLQEVPVAVSVVDNQTIAQAQVFDILDLQTLVPSLRVTQLQSSANTNFLIRGFGNGANNPGIEPSVGVFIDGVYRSRSAAAISDLPNLERVEVLRGPQSTLFGKNASAGVISVVTALPDTEFGGSIEGAIGNYGLTVIKGDLQIPLSDTAGFSISGGLNQRDGYFDNLEDGEELNERDRWNIRAQLALTPTDNISLRFIGDYDELDEQCCGVANLLAGPTAPVIQAIGGNLVPNQPFAYTSFLNTNPVNTVENSGISMQADIDMGEATLTSITSFRNVARFETIDADHTSVELLDGLISNTNIDTFTQELRWSTSGDNIDFLIGAFYFDESVNYDSEAIYGSDIRLYFDLLAGGGVPGTFAGLEGALGIPVGAFFFPGTGSREFSGQDNQALSIFSQFDWHIGDRATLTLGVNYTEDDKDAFIRTQNNDLFSSLDFVFIGFAQAFAQLEAMDPGNPANGPTAQAISTNPCPPAGALPCNPLLGLQAIQVLPPFVDFPNSVESGSSDDSETTWTVRFAFDINDSWNIYASAATGFKATSWNLSRDSRSFASDLPALQSAGLFVPNWRAGTRFAEPEESTVYELGVKARFDRGALNFAVFDQSLENFQQNIFSGLGFNLINAGEQSTQGVEVDATWYPTESLQLTFGGTFMDPKYDSFPNGVGPNGPNTDLSGTQPAGIHEQSIVASATWTRDLANGMSLFLRGEYLYESDVQVVDNIPASVASREVNVFNASAGLSTEGGWDFTLWGRNITDDEYLLSAFPGVAQAGTVNGYPNAPATYGLTVRKVF